MWLAMRTYWPRVAVLFWLKIAGVWSVGLFHNDCEYLFDDLVCGRGTTSSGNAKVVGDLRNGECACSSRFDMWDETATLTVGECTIQLERIAHIEIHPLSGSVPHECRRELSVPLEDSG